MAPRLDQTKRSLPHSGPPEHKACVSRAEALHAYPRVSRLSLAFFRTHHHPLRPPRGERTQPVRGKRPLETSWRAMCGSPTVQSDSRRQAMCGPSPLPCDTQPHTRRRVSS